MDMKWHDLLFMHYPVPVEQLRPLIPEALEIDTFEGEAWIAVVPFHMTDVKPYKFPSMPWLSAFAELNVRTYVKHSGKGGVWFFSLDAANPIAVNVARRFFLLPYFNAQMSTGPVGDAILYRSTRTHRGAPGAEFHARYHSTGPVFAAKPGSIEHWLTERYCLYSANRRGKVARVDVDHVRWPLQNAGIELRKNTMLQWLGVTPADTEPLLHFSRTLEVRAWLPEWLP